MCRRTHPLRQLTRRGCLNGAPQARSEFHGAPRARAPQVARSEAKGSQTAGSPFFWVRFFGEAKKRTQKKGDPVVCSHPFWMRLRRAGRGVAGVPQDTPASSTDSPWLFERSAAGAVSSTAHPRTSTPGCPAAKRRGRRQQGRLFFWVRFFGEAKKRTQKERRPCLLPTPFWMRLRRAGAGWRVCRRTHPLRQLTRRGCLNGAPQARVSSTAPRARAPQVAPQRSEGVADRGHLSFGYVSLAKQRNVPKRKATLLFAPHPFWMRLRRAGRGVAGVPQDTPASSTDSPWLFERSAAGAQ